MIELADVLRLFRSFSLSLSLSLLRLLLSVTLRFPLLILYLKKCIALIARITVRGHRENSVIDTSVRFSKVEIRR